MNVHDLIFFSNVCLIFSLVPALFSATNFTAQAVYSKDFYVTWGTSNVRSVNKGHVWELVLDNKTASGIATKKHYLFGSFNMFIKLCPGDSAGLVTAFYFSSLTTYWDELDFEFLGNVSEQPIILQTNVFWNGTGGREERVFLWFDPTTGYHNYTVLWNSQQILFLVDGYPIRVVRNKEAMGIPFIRQPMKLFASIWDGSSWATRGGRDKLDWGKAPFISSFGKYRFDACRPTNSSCPEGKWWNTTQLETMSADQQTQLAWVEQNYKVYDYCDDRVRYPVVPAECPD